MPVPSQLPGVLQTLLSVNVEPHVGSRALGGRVGADNARREIPNCAFAVGLHRLEVAFDVGPVPARLVFLIVLAGLLLHLINYFEQM